MRISVMASQQSAGNEANCASERSTNTAYRPPRDRRGPIPCYASRRVGGVGGVVIDVAVEVRLTAAEALGVLGRPAARRRVVVARVIVLPAGVAVERLGRELQLAPVAGARLRHNLAVGAVLGVQADAGGGED